MIAKVKVGTNFTKLMKYLVHEREYKNLGDNMGDIEVEDQIEAFKCVSDQNKRLKNKVFHGSLSLPIDESLTSQQWRECADIFMSDMGFSNAPYSIIRHFDKEYEHIHICASRVDYDGNTISDSKSYTRAMESVRRIERLYSLGEVKFEKKDKTNNQKTAQEIHAERRGQKLIKTKIKDAIHASIKQGSGKKLETFVSSVFDQLRKQGIKVVRHKHKNGNVYGLSFEMDGKVFKSSKLGKKYQLKPLFQTMNVAFKRHLLTIEKQQHKKTFNKPNIGLTKSVNQLSNHLKQQSYEAELEEDEITGNRRKRDLGM
ncbi:relaxase/mobilization nuclease domain-containing protein [Reichenbachiella ulvae]|uniref:Relaxase/mobilization nuclease domain-containing protein n=1 Tax=Reichenbachiella ulvae TaxID=2980104 RepID=A0ABT3CZN6_9BACT|nr:relaxase/mobilization nuclease domain-containing protein [Reichenbachiella ulvae]MCV9389155.1 relaxase/mobilization nuclease domain-containing protein [Reichenbachiella ulvae]